MTLSKTVRIRYVIDQRSTVRGLNSIKKSLDEVRSSTEKAAKSASGLDKALARASTNKLSGSFRDTSSAAGGLESAFGGLTTSLTGPAGFVAGAVATGAAISALNSKALELAERASAVTNVFQNVPIPIEAARRSTRGLVTDFDLARLASDAVSLGVTDNAKTFGELSGALQKLGARRGVDALKSIEDGFTAIGRGSTALLDNLGITLKVAEAQEEYAQILGKTTGELTDAERAEAFREVATRRVIDAARDVTITTDDAASAVRRFNVELQNIEDRALGGSVASLSLAEGLRQVSSEQTIDVGALRNYGSSVADLNNQLRDLGVASSDIPNSIEALTRAAENANIEVSRLAGLEDLRRQAQERDPEFIRAQQRAEAERQSVENARLRLKEIEEEQAFLVANNTAIAQKAELQIEALRLQSLIAKFAGDEERANRLARDAELAQLRELGRIANVGTGRRGRGRRRDPFADERAEFQRQLTDAINAERLREFSEATSLQRNYLADVRAFESELAQARQPSIDRFALERERAEFLAEFQENAAQRTLEVELARADSDAERFRLQQEAFAAREAQISREIELTNDLDERARLQDERDSVRHQATLARIEEERRAREEAAQGIQNAIQSVSAAENGAFQLSATIAGATIKGEQRKKRVLDGIKAGGLFADGAVASAQSVIAFASGNVPQGIALAAAAANAFAQGSIIAAGNARGGGGGGGRGPTAAGEALSRGEPVQRAQFSVDRGAPISVREDIEGNPNNTTSSNAAQSSRTVVIERIDVLGAIDDDSAAKIRKGLARTEANLGV